MSLDTEKLDHDVGFYEYEPGLWLPGKMGGVVSVAITPRAVDATRKMALHDDDVLVASYPKTGTSNDIHQTLGTKHTPRKTYPPHSKILASHLNQNRCCYSMARYHKCCVLARTGHQELSQMYSI